MIYTPQESTIALPLPRFNDEHESTLPAAHVAVSTFDSCGKVADRSALRYIDWRCGQHITFIIADGVVKITEKQGGKYVIEQHGYLRLPAEIRTCARINRRDRLLLLAIREFRTLLIYPSVQAVAALRSFTPLVWQQR